MLDGNAHFWTAVEAVRRGLAVATSRDAIVVGIGYPDCGHYVFGGRRSYDLTPPCPNYTAPRSWDGKTFDATHGGADALLDFIQGPVRTYLCEHVFIGFNLTREVLLGHSYGALCALHALFRGDTVFDTFVALSPAIWWSDKFILVEQEAFLARKGRQNVRDLYLAYGHYEQYPRKRKSWSDDEYTQRAKNAESLRTNDAAEEMAARLSLSDSMAVVKCKAYPDEDHGSVAGCALGWAICDILDPDRFA